MNYVLQNMRSNLLGWGLGLSLFVHFLMLVAQIPVWKQNEFTEANQAPIEVVQPKPEWYEQQKKMAAVPKMKTKDLEIAETEDAGNRKIDPNAKVLSDRNQTAPEQTRAKKIDDFKAKQGTGANGEKAGEEGEARPADETSIGLNDKPQGKKDWKELSIKDLGVGGDGGAVAASDDHLDDIRTGDRTVLSTREFKYFAYYQRIKELLRQYWKPNVERQLARVWAKGRSVSEEEMVTQLQVLLDPNGSIQKISRLASSGFPEIDDAAVEAFNRAGPFPNPPKGMLDTDGLVRIRWDFILKTESAPRIQFRNAGAAGGGSGGAAY